MTRAEYGRFVHAVNNYYEWASDDPVHYDHQGPFRAIFDAMKTIFGRRHDLLTEFISFCPYYRELGSSRRGSIKVDFILSERIHLFLPESQSEEGASYQKDRETKIQTETRKRKTEESEDPPKRVRAS